MMVKSKIYKGIEYVQISELPAEQQEILTQSIVKKNLIIKILINGKLVSDCLQFRDYSLWYESVFKATAILEEVAAKNMAKIMGSQKLVLKEN